MGVWAAAAACSCPKASINCHGPRAAHPAHGQRRQCSITARHARRRVGAVHHVVVTVFGRAPAPRQARELSFREKNCRRPHEIWARRSGHFSMPATALHRSKSYLSRPVAPFNAAGRTLFGPTRVPHDGSRIPPARSCPPLCLKVLCEPVDSPFLLKSLNGVLCKTRLTEQGMVATWERSDRAPCALVGRAPSEGRGDGCISNRVSR